MYKIIFTKHALRRMNQRAITKEMIEIAIYYGKYVGDKIILNAHTIKKYFLREKRGSMKKKLLKLLDKGGIVVVMGDDFSVITTYRYTGGSI